MRKDKEYLTVNELIDVLKQVDDDFMIYYEKSRVEHEGKNVPVYNFLNPEKMKFAKMRIA